MKTRARSHCSFQRGRMSIDLTGKKSGRGAYLSKDKESILQAQKKNVLDII
ncbi:YlxR family protein [Bacillus thuringiensis]|uniref:YlxR family protein n=1 Tax=Bacillus thuringiensis TaxID=1428 RepID=UPI003703C5ED